MEPLTGSLRVFLDADVRQNNDNEWSCLSREPAETGEVLVLDIESVSETGGDVRDRLPVCVIECLPVILDGDLRYRIRMLGGLPAPILFEQQVRRG
jgi:hypothetical protein